MPRESRIEETAQQRRSRIPLSGPSYRLGWNGEQLPGVPRWINDDGAGRIERAKQAGYTPVTAVDPEGRSQTGDSVVSQIVGSRKDGSGPMRAYLMVQSHENYADDQQAKQAQLDEDDKAIRRGRLGDAKGIPDADKQYSDDPRTGQSRIRMESR